MSSSYVILNGEPLVSNGVPPVIVSGGAPTAGMTIVATDATDAIWADITASTSIVDVKLYGAKGDGVTDDTVDIQNAVNAVAGSGISLFMSAGTYKVTSPITVPSNTTIIGTPNTTISATLPVGSFLDSVFLAVQGSTLASTTLSSNATVGSPVLHVTSATGISIGSIIEVDNATVSGNRAAYYLVTGVSGTAITVERPVLIAFNSTDPVLVLASIPTNIRILGNGMKMSGVCARYIELAAARNCQVDNVIFGGNTTNQAQDICVSLDVGGYRSVISNCLADADGYAGSTCFALESGEACRLDNNIATRSVSYGFNLYDCMECTVNKCKSYANGGGIALNSDGDTLGSSWCSIHDSNFDGNTQDGIIVVGSSNDCTFVGCTSNYNGRNGLSTSNNSVAISLVSCSLNNNLSGVVSSSGSETHLVNCDVANNSSINLDVSGLLYVNGLTMVDNLSNNKIYIRSGGILKMSGLNLSSTAAGVNIINIDAGQTGKLDLLQSKITAASANALVCQAGSMRIAHTTVAANIGIYAAGGTIELGDGMDVSGCTTATRVDSGNIYYISSVPFAQVSNIAPINSTIVPQAPFASATGSNGTPASLLVNLAAPVSTGAEAGLIVNRGGVFSAQLGPYLSAGSAFSALYLGPGVTPSTVNPVLIADPGTVTYLNTPSGGTLRLCTNVTARMAITDTLVECIQPALFDATINQKGFILNDGYSGGITIDGTLSTLYTSQAIATSAVNDFIASVVGLDSADGYVYRADFSFTYQRIASAAPSLVGPAAVPLNVRASAGASGWGGASIALSGNTVQLQVQGATSRTIHWSCTWSQVSVT